MAKIINNEKKRTKYFRFNRLTQKLVVGKWQLRVSSLAILTLGLALGIVAIALGISQH